MPAVDGGALALALPFGYPWTGHADELDLACTSGGCSYLVEAIVTGTAARCWQWKITVPASSSPFVAYFDSRGYFYSGYGGNVVWTPSWSWRDRYSRRTAFDRFMLTIRNGGHY